MLTAAYTGVLASISILLDTAGNSYFSDGYRAEVISSEASQKISALETSMANYLWLLGSYSVLWLLAIMCTTCTFNYRCLIWNLWTRCGNIMTRVLSLDITSMASSAFPCEVPGSSLDVIIQSLALINLN